MRLSLLSEEVCNALLEEDFRYLKLVHAAEYAGKEYFLYEPVRDNQAVGAAYEPIAVPALPTGEVRAYVCR
ncbi:MAG: hypothetical protein JNL72_12305 [Flavipsychrobacter sp.]|nr:hypothetical protein [Flavipsychrobacter sp.]